MEQRRLAVTSSAELSAKGRPLSLFLSLALEQSSGSNVALLYLYQNNARVEKEWN